MAYLVKKNKYKNIIYSKPFLLFLLLMIILISRGVWGVYKKERDTSNTLRSITKNLQEAEERRTILLERIEKMNTKKGIESEIRKSFNLAKKGEKLIIIINNEEEGDITFQNKISFWDWIKNIFR